MHDETASRPSQSIPKPTSTFRRPIFWIIGSVVLVAAAVVSLVVALTLTSQLVTAQVAPTGPSAPDEGAVPTETATTAPVMPTPVPTEAARATPAAPVIAIPSTCDGIYTHDLTDSFEGMVLNPSWSENPHQMRIGSSDDTAASVLAAEAVLTCKWGSPAGPGGRGLVTNIAPIDAPIQASMPDHLASIGQTCYEELGGIRCVIESAPSSDGNGGESHFFRDGIWIATKWINAGPDGYTHDIVEAMFGLL